MLRKLCYGDDCFFGEEAPLLPLYLAKGMVIFMKYSVDYMVDFHHTDINGIASASAVMRYIHEAANLQLEKYGPTIKDLEADNKVFILSRTSMRLYEPLREFEKLTAQTWHSQPKGASFDRYGRIFRDDTVVAELFSVFALVDTKENRICRADEKTFSFEPDLPIELNLPKRISIPKDTILSVQGERKVYYMDCDRNGHMNNTVYPDMLCGFLPNMVGKRVSSIMINYLSEAKLGSSFKVYHGECGGIDYIRTLKEDGVIGAMAQITTEDIN